MDPRAEAALRGMISHSDERFQSLHARVRGMEDNLLALTNATRELRAAITRGAAINPDGSVDTAGISEIRTQLSELERHLAAAFAQQARREAALIEAVESKVHEETVSAVSETDNKVQALEQTFREATGALAEMVASAKLQADRLDKIRFSGNEVSLAGLQVDPGEIVDALEQRVVPLAAIIRSDSSRIAEKLEAIADQQRRETAKMLDARLGRVSELVSATTMSAVSEVARQVPELAKAAMDEKTAEMTAAIEASFVELADTTETEAHRMGRYLAERTAELVDAAIAGRLSATLERISQAADAIEAGSPNVSGGLDEAATADISAMIDDRITALAKMIRSDNKTMAGVLEVAAEQQAAKQATRAVKEMAASLPAQIMDVIDRRFAELADSLHRETQSTVVAVAKASDVLSERIGEIENRYETGVERAADKLGDAVANALANRRI